MMWLRLFEDHHKTSGFQNKSDSNLPAKLDRVARGWKFQMSRLICVSV